MRSGMSSRKRPSVGSAGQFTDETYDLEGLNLVAPDQVMPNGRTAVLANTRRYADQENESSVAQRTRKGSTVLSTPIGETLKVRNIATSTGSIAVSLTSTAAVSFASTGTGVLTHITLNMKKDAGSTGYVVVELWTSASGAPGTMLAQSSIIPNRVTTSFADLAVYFMDAPNVVSGTTYFLVARLRELGTGSYYLSQTAGSGAYTSADGGKTWTSLSSSARYATYVSTAGNILGFTKRYPESSPNRTVFAFGTGIYQMADFPAAPTLVETYTDAGARWVRFVNVDETTFYCDGTSHPRQWDGVNSPADITNIPLVNGPSINLIVHQNRLMSVPANDPTRIDFSALYDFTSWPSVNFMYIGRPNSPDAITAWCEFQNGMTVFTRESKYTLLGTDITSFTPTPHAGTKGAISQEAIAVGKGVVYFMSDDRHIYQWNGTADTDISLEIIPELKKILDISKVRFHLYNNQLRIYYNRNPDPDVTYMLLYDIPNNDWYKDTGRAVAGSMEWAFDHHELIEFSSRAGWLFSGEQGYSDLGKPIDWKYYTNYKSYAYKQRSGRIIGGAATKKHIRRFRPVVRPANAPYNLTVGHDFDFKNTPIVRPWLVDAGGTKWGTFTWGDGTTYSNNTVIMNSSPISGRGRLVQYQFSHSVIDDPVELYGYISIVRLGKPM